MFGKSMLKPRSHSKHYYSVALVRYSTKILLLCSQRECEVKFNSSCCKNALQNSKAKHVICSQEVFLSSSQIFRSYILAYHHSALRMRLRCNVATQVDNH